MPSVLDRILGRKPQADAVKSPEAKKAEEAMLLGLRERKAEPEPPKQENPAEMPVTAQESKKEEVVMPTEIPEPEESKEEEEITCDECGGIISEEDTKCPHCGVEFEDETDKADETGEDEEEPSEELQEEQEEPSAPEERPAEAKPSKPPVPPSERKFHVVKHIRKSFLRKDGSQYLKPVFQVLETYIGDPPTKADIETFLVPMYGGGEYIVKEGKRLYQSYTFPGPPIDVAPDEIQAPHTPAAPAAPAPPPPSAAAIDRLGAALSSNQNAAVDRLARLAEQLLEKGEVEKANSVIQALKELATGQKSVTPQDQFFQYLINQQQQQQTLLNQLILQGRQERSADPMKMMEGMLGTMEKGFNVMKGMLPQGEDPTVAIAREVSGTVRDSMKDVTDTLVRVTGSGALKEEPGTEQRKQRFVCSQCGSEVEPSFRICPKCGLRFKPGAFLPPAPPSVPQPEAEVFEGKAPPLPKEVLARLGYLRNLAVFIQQGHDPEKKAALFTASSPDEKLGLLFTADFGYKNLMRLAQPYRQTLPLEDRDAIFQIIESQKGQDWINQFFNAVKSRAKEENIVLSDALKRHFIDQINKYSAVKFTVKERPSAPQVPLQQSVVATPPPPAPSPTAKPTNGTVQCVICGESIPLAEYEAHLKSAHPKKQTAPPGAVVLEAEPKERDSGLRELDEDDLA
jgi:hypothetical protein